MPPPPHGSAAAVQAHALGKRDPMLAALLAAPLDDEPETDEERAAFDVIEADIRAGRRGAGPAEIARALERMRLDQGE